MVLLLFEQIVQLFLCVILGWFLVRLRLLKPTDSRVLSVVCLYLIIPASSSRRSKIERTPELLQGLALSLGTAIGIHVLFFVAAALLHRPLHLTPVEQASIIYTNAGNLIIPLVTAVLGPEWGHLLQHVPAGAAVPPVEPRPHPPERGAEDLPEEDPPEREHPLRVHRRAAVRPGHLHPPCDRGHHGVSGLHGGAHQHDRGRHADGGPGPPGGAADPQHLEGGLPAADRPAPDGAVHPEVLGPCRPGGGRAVHPDDQPAGGQRPRCPPTSPRWPRSTATRGITPAPSTSSPPCCASAPCP